MASNTQRQAASFTLVLERFKASLSAKERSRFQFTTLQDLHITIEEIQKKQATKKRLQGMQRLERFLEGMTEFDKVIQVFVNTSSMLAFIWGPMKFLLQTASTFSEAFDSLLDAYQRIGEHIPLLTQYEALFRSQPHMARVLTLMYEEILQFHQKAMKYFAQRMWKQLFHAVWKSFDTEFSAILRNLREHRYLIERQATIAQFEEIMRAQELAKVILASAQEAEVHRRRETVYQWLSSANTDADQERHAKVRLEYPGTGQWLKKADRFLAWFEPDLCFTPLLWLSGIPGAGKTILASMIIEEARKLPGVSVAFFYCKYQDSERSTFLAVARAIIAQLLRQDDALLHYLYDKTSTSGQVSLSTATMGKELLETVTRNFKKLYIVLDGLDECDREERREIATVFQMIWQSLPVDENDSLRCVFICQDDGVSRKDFADISSLKITEHETKQDISSYAHAWSKKIQDKFRLPDERQSFIEHLISDKAEGMFLFASLMSRYLLDQTTKAALDQELAPGNFPQGPLKLDQAYSKIVDRLFAEDASAQRNDTSRLLSWLVCAKRPLKWREIQGAISVDVEEQVVDWESHRLRVDSKELCGSLVDIRKDDTVDLVHHTAKRYLVDRKIVNAATGELSFALRCTGYLSLPSFYENMSESDVRNYIFRGYYAFFDYAIVYWFYHLEKSLSSPQAADALQDLSEALGVFIEMHWTESAATAKHSIPKSALERLKAIKEHERFDDVALAVYAARKLLNPSGKSSSEEHVLSLGQIVARVRSSLENIAADTSSRSELEPFYGECPFKCPLIHCTRFYNGFSTGQLRDEHVLKHERSFFCSFPSCPTATFGCATLKELRKHETEFHGSFEFDDEGDTEFPEIPPEKASFDCAECDQKFTRKHNLKIHMRTHQAPDEKAFKCTQCGEAFKRQGDRTRHEKSFHSGAEKFRCGGILKNGVHWGCGRSFDRADVLQRHFRSDKGRTCRLPLVKEEEAAEREMPQPTAQANPGP